MSWHEKGIKTSQEARELGAAYSKDSFAVMRAFGINNRKAAPPEQGSRFQTVFNKLDSVLTSGKGIINKIKSENKGL